MSDVITSRLWKSGALPESNGFPQLVRAAAQQAGKAYTTPLLQTVAANPAVLDAIVLHRGEGMDAALEAMATDPQAAQALDDAIVAAVIDYTEETP